MRLLFLEFEGRSIAGPPTKVGAPRSAVLGAVGRFYRPQDHLRNRTLSDYFGARTVPTFSGSEVTKEP